MKPTPTKNKRKKGTPQIIRWMLTAKNPTDIAKLQHNNTQQSQHHI
jgi:hypothetical protein